MVNGGSTGLTVQAVCVCARVCQGESCCLPQCPRSTERTEILMHSLKWQREREGRLGEGVREDGGTEGDRGTSRRTEERPNSLSKNLISPESPWKLGCQSRQVPPLLGCSHADHWLTRKMSHFRFIILHLTASLGDRQPGGHQAGNRLVYVIIKSNHIFTVNQLAFRTDSTQ